jgi:hypothetical protein
VVKRNMMIACCVISVFMVAGCGVFAGEKIEK